MEVLSETQEERKRLQALIEENNLTDRDLRQVLKIKELNFKIKKPGKSFQQMIDSIVSSGQLDEVLDYIQRGIRDGWIKQAKQKRQKRNKDVPKDDDGGGDDSPDDGDSDGEILERLKAELAIRGKTTTGNFKRLLRRLLSALEEEE